MVRARRPRRVDVYPDCLELRDWTQLTTRSGGRILIPRSAVAGVEPADQATPDADEIERNTRIVLGAPYEVRWRYGPGPTVLSLWHNRRETKKPVPREIAVDFDAPGAARPCSGSGCAHSRIRFPHLDGATRPLGYCRLRDPCSTCRSRG